MDKSKPQEQPKSDQENKNPDHYHASAAIKIQDHIKIFDPETKTVYVNKR